MNRMLRNLLFVAGVLVAGSAAAQITLYSGEGFSGGTFSADRQVWNLDRQGFNDQARSAVVRGGSWEVCTDARFEGRCVILRPGDYPSLESMGLGGNISSMREVNNYGRDDRGYSPNMRDNDRYNRNYRNDNRYEYRNDGWRFDRYENRWERY